VSSVKITHPKSTKLNTILIDRNDLFKLNKLMMTAFSEEDKFNVDISTDYDNITIKDNSVDDFLLYDGLPDKLNNLDIRYSSKDKYVFMMLGDYRLHLFVSGNDETWMLGIFHQLKSFFANRRPWYYSRNILKSFFIIITALIIASLPNIYSKAYVFTAIVLATIAASCFYIGLTDYFEKLFPFFELRLSPKSSIIDVQMIAVIIGVLTLIATIIGGIIIPFWNK
jgi:hypothetical protein